MRMKLTHITFIGLIMTVLAVTANAQMAAGQFMLGSDGTVYIINHVAPTSTSSASTVLTAYNGANGSQKFVVTIPVGILTQPVSAPDGRLFLVAEGHPAFTTKTATVAAEDAQVFIVNPATAATGHYTTIALPGETVFGPVFFGTSASYTYYFTITSFSKDSSGKLVMSAMLHAYRSKDDTEVFSIPQD